MAALNPSYSDFMDREDHYQVETDTLVAAFLEAQGVTREMLKAMPPEKAGAILNEAHAYAAHQIARREAMVRLGNRDVESKPESQYHRRHGDPFDRHVNRKAMK